jgi:hypothetical protein
MARDVLPASVGVCDGRPTCLHASFQVREQSDCCSHSSSLGVVSSMIRVVSVYSNWPCPDNRAAYRMLVWLRSSLGRGQAHGTGDFGAATIVWCQAVVA